MRKIDEMKNKLSKLKSEAENLINSNKIIEAKSKMEDIKNLKNEIEVQEKEDLKELELLRNNAKTFNFENDNKKSTIVNSISSKDSFYNAVCRGEEKKNLSIGKYVRGMLTGDWNNASNEMNEFRALNTSTGKTLIPKQLSATVIDLARPNMVLKDIPIIPMDSNNMTIAKIVKDSNVSFKQELVDAEVSDMTFGEVELKSKMVYGLMKISLELLKSAQNIDQVIEQAMAQALSQAIDKSGLYGTLEHEPKGILTYTDINKVESDLIENSKYTSFVKGIGAITKANGYPTTIGYNSNIDTSLSLLTDTTGQPLNAPKVIEDLTHTVSNNINDNEAIVFDSNSIVMGLQNQITIDTSEALGFMDGSVYLRVYAMLDIAILNPKNITKITYQTPMK